jgi:hypothetical protein
MAFEDAGELLAGELAALVGIEDLRGAVGLDRLLLGLDAEARIQGVGNAPRQYLARGPVQVPGVVVEFAKGFSGE